MFDGCPMIKAVVAAFAIRSSGQLSAEGTTAGAAAS